MEQKGSIQLYREGRWGQVVTLIASILIFGLLVVSHEFGHFIVAKRTGVFVEEFSIGMGPKLIDWGKNETKYSLRVFPIGGYVKMLGEDEDAQGEGSYQNQPLGNRIGIIVAGPIMNFLLAILIFSLIFFIIGTPTTYIDTVKPGYPADKAGIKPGDKVYSIGGEIIDSWEGLQRSISTFTGDKLEVKVERNGDKHTFILAPVKDPDTGQIVIGITPQYSKNPLKALAMGAKRSIAIIGLMLSYIADLVTGKASAGDLVGAVGMIHLVSEAAKTGILNLMFLAGLLSLNLGVINLLPIPALDGGKLFFLLLEAVRGKPVDLEKESLIHFIGFILLIVLMIMVTYKDIIRFNLF
jgi:regulator of sigma E protease